MSEVLHNLVEGVMGRAQDCETHLQGGRMCVVVPVSADAPPKGILLGSSAGCLYVEPPAAVALNNDLAAARGEAATAAEAVLWRLTGDVIDAVSDLERLLDVVRRLQPHAP